MDSWSFAWSFVKMLASLAIVIAMLILAMQLLKKYGHPAGGAARGNPAIRIVSTCYLGPKSSILLIDVLGELLVVGVSGGQMSTLGTITDPGAREQLQDLRLREPRPGAPDPLARYRSLWRSVSRPPKER